MNRYRTDIKQFGGFNASNGMIYGGVLSPLYMKTEKKQNCVFDRHGTKYALDGSTLTKTPFGGETESLFNVTEQHFIENEFYAEWLSDAVCMDMYADSDGNGVFVSVHPMYLSNTQYRIVTRKVAGWNVSAEEMDVRSCKISDVLTDDVYRLKLAPPTEAGGGFCRAFFVAAGAKKTCSAALIIDNEANITGGGTQDDGTLFPYSSPRFITMNTLETYGTENALVTIKGEGGTAVTCSLCATGVFERTAGRLYTVIFRYRDGSETPKFPPNNALIAGEEKSGRLYPNMFYSSSADTYLLGGEITVLDDNNNLYVEFTAQFADGNPADNFGWYLSDRCVGFFRCYVPSKSGTIWVATSNTFDAACATVSVTEDGYDFPNFNGYFEYGDFRLLVNTAADGTLYTAGISYGTAGSLGTLLTDWNSVDENMPPVFHDNFAMYRNNGGKIRIIALVDGAGKLSLVNDRYVVVNTPFFYNAYDIEKGKQAHFATDWNDRVYLRGKYLDDGSEFFASATNANYEATGDGIVSYMASPRVIKQCDYENLKAFGAMNADVDVYDGTAQADYKFTLSVKLLNNAVYYITKENAALAGVNYPVATDGNIIYTPSLLTKFLKTYFNKDGAIVGGTYYPLVYSGTEAVAAYFMLGGLDGVSDVFVIQGQTYALISEKIFALSYADGVVSATELITDVTGMTYVGANTKTAFFFSEFERTLWAFSGDNVLSVVQNADRIKAVNGAFYNPITQTILVSTTDETFANGAARELPCLYLIGKSTTRLDGIAPVSALYYTDKKFIVLETDGGLVYLSYTPIDGFDRMTLSVETEYYGIGDNGTSVVDCWYLRFFNQNERKAGKIRLRARSLTDKGTETEEKAVAVTAEMWDKLTNTLYLRYQPAKQRGVGAQLCIESDFAIGQIACDYLPDTQQVAHVNA